MAETTPMGVATAFSMVEQHVVAPSDPNVPAFEKGRLSALDIGSETQAVTLQQDGGGTDNNVKAGKRGNTDQQGIDLGPARHAIEQAGNSADDFTPDRISECARRTRPLRRCPGRAPAREKDRGCPRMVPQCGMDDGAYSRTVCAHRAQSQGERGGEGPETAGLSIFAHAWTGNSRTSIFAHA